MSDKNIVNIWVVAIALLLIWGSLLWFFVEYAHEVKTDPCTVCSEKHGEQVFCSVIGMESHHRIYYPNGSIRENKPIVIVKENYPQLNTSAFNFTSN